MLAFVSRPDGHRTWLEVGGRSDVYHWNELRLFDHRSCGHSPFVLAIDPAFLRRPRRSHSLLLLELERHSGICRIDLLGLDAGDALVVAAADGSDARCSHWQEI